MAIIYDGTTEVSLSENDILHEISVRQAVQYYKMTEIYYSVVKQEYSKKPSYPYMLLNETVKQGRDLLFKRLQLELGEDNAALIAADILLKIRLADDE